MLTLQREENFPDGVSDREHHAPAALPYPDDLSRAEVHLGPPERHAFLLPHATGPDEFKERLVVPNSYRDSAV
jgi:hypothetical protein